MRLVLLDRDGVLNRDRSDYVLAPDQLHLEAGSAAAVARLNRAGVPVAVVTNQACVGKGLIDADGIAAIHGRLADLLAAEGAHMDLLLACFDHPDHATDRRKPGPGMLREALARFDVPAAAAPMIGDSLRDLQAAAALGCPRHLVRTGHGPKTEAALANAPDLAPVTVHDHLAAAVDHLLAAP